MYKIKKGSDTLGKKKKQKKGKHENLQKIAFATVIINLLISIIDLIKSIIK